MEGPQLTIHPLNSEYLAFMEACKTGSLERIKQTYKPDAMAEAFALIQFSKRGRLDALKWICEQDEKGELLLNGTALYHGILHRKWNVVNWVLKQKRNVLFTEMEREKQTEVMVYIMKVFAQLCQFFHMTPKELFRDVKEESLQTILEWMESFCWTSSYAARQEKTLKMHLFSPKSLRRRVLLWARRFFKMPDTPTGKRKRMESRCPEGDLTENMKRLKLYEGSKESFNGESRIGLKRFKSLKSLNVLSNEETKLKAVRTLGTGKTKFDRLFIQRLSIYLMECFKEGENRIFVPAPDAKHCEAWHRIYSGAVSDSLKEYGLNLKDRVVEFAVERIILVLRSETSNCIMDYGFSPYNGWFLQGFNPKLFLLERE